MEDLSQAQITELKQALESLEIELAETLVQTGKSSDTVDLDEPIGRLSRMDAIQQQRMAQAGRAAAQRRLHQVEAALVAMRGDDYGLCKQCEEPIDFKRLQARPEAPLCVECQSAIEKR